jgi:hypothetical protein
MFHECLFISPDLDGHRAPKKSINPERPSVFISPDIDGHPKRDDQKRRYRNQK